MFQLRAPKCPNCHAPLKVGREVIEIDCGYCGSHVQVRKPKKQKPAFQQQQPKHSNRGWKRDGNSNAKATRPRVGMAIGLSALGLVGLSAVAVFLLSSVDTGGEAGASQGQVEPVASVPATESPSSPTEAAAKKEKKVSKNKSKRHGRRKSKKGAKNESRSKVESENRSHSKPKLTKAAAGKILRSVRMLHCSASGTTKVSVVIAASGTVQSAQASGDMPESESRCISDTVKALRFPPSIDGLHTSQRYKW